MGKVTCDVIISVDGFSAAAPATATGTWTRSLRHARGVWPEVNRCGRRAGRTRG